MEQVNESTFAVEGYADIRGRRKSRVRTAFAILLGIIGLGYLATSAVVIVNSFVWLPSLPSAWYSFENLLYWPFQPYFDLTLSMLGTSDIPYNVYAAVTRAPFVLFAAVLLIITIGLSRTGHAEAQR